MQKLRAALGQLCSFLSELDEEENIKSAAQAYGSRVSVSCSESSLFPVVGPSEESWFLLSLRPGSGMSAGMGGLAGLARAAFPAMCLWQPSPPVRVQGHQVRMMTGLRQEQRGSLGLGGCPGLLLDCLESRPLLSSLKAPRARRQLSLHICHLQLRAGQE